MGKTEVSLLAVHLQPGASGNGVLGFTDGVLKVRVNAPPVEGKANNRLVELLSDVFQVSRSNVVIVRGHTGRHKLVHIGTLSAAQIKERLESYLQEHGG